MPVTVTGNGRELTARISGEVDHHGAREIMEELDREIDAALPGRLALDLSGVTFMDSSGIGLVMGRYRLMQELGGELRVTGVPSHIRKVMRLSGLDKLAVMEPEGRHPAPNKPKPKPEKAAVPQERASTEGASPMETARTLTVTIPVPPEELELSPDAWGGDGKTE